MYHLAFHEKIHDEVPVYEYDKCSIVKVLVELP